MTLEKTFQYLSIGGKIIVISYHSLEERIVKKIFKKKEREGNFKILTKKPLSASNEEIKINHRSRSAKMRVILKLS